MPRPDKRADVMQATLEIIAEQGFHDAPTSQIAERAQVGMGTIYRYFKSKDDLIHAIFKDRISSAKEYMLTDYDRSQPLEQRFLFLAQRLFDYMVEHPLDYSFYEQYRTSPYGPHSELENLLAYERNDTSGDYPFMTIFKEGQKQKVVKQMQFPMLSALTLSPIFALVGQVIAGTLKTDQQEMEQLFLACWDAITV